MHHSSDYRFSLSIDFLWCCGCVFILLPVLLFTARPIGRGYGLCRWCCSLRARQHVRCEARCRWSPKWLLVLSTTRRSWTVERHCFPLPMCGAPTVQHIAHHTVKQSVRISFSIQHIFLLFLCDVSSRVFFVFQIFSCFFFFVLLQLCVSPLFWLISLFDFYSIFFVV
jgi:hypothetical protein